EREDGVRALLNLGHTFAHALEVEVGYSGDLLHGEAVAIGIVMAFDLSAKIGLCSNDDAARVRAHFKSIGLRTDPSDIQNIEWTTDRLLQNMSQDKKVRDGSINFILARGIGEAFITNEVSDADIRAVLDRATGA
ncbi:MAG: 3-dehydroquinate synthase, partial [Rhodospirillales bacterium]|nr:3-dehydroquinate synthase [Rhodospirillales bacterium]